MQTFIIGHQKPDTDAVVATLALEYLYSNMKNSPYSSLVPAITHKLNPETNFIFEKLQVTPPKIISTSDIKQDDQVILVDHNEPSQRLDNLNPDQIVEIIDHHKANLDLNKPIILTFKNWGSTNTIIYDLMKQNQITPDRKTAELMLAAILSDTVGYKSATTTKKDKAYGEELTKIAKVTSIDEFTFEILKAKSDISSLSDLQIVTNDYKIFAFSKKTLINQVETVEQEQVLNRKNDLLKAMAKAKQEHNVDLVFCAVSDILKVNTKLLLLSEDEATIAETAFSTKSKDNIIDIGSKLSRKKEIAPPIEKVLS